MPFFLTRFVKMNGNKRADKSLWIFHQWMYEWKNHMCTTYTKINVSITNVIPSELRIGSLRSYMRGFTVLKLQPIHNIILGWRTHVVGSLVIEKVTHFTRFAHICVWMPEYASFIHFKLEKQHRHIYFFSVLSLYLFFYHMRILFLSLLSGTRFVRKLTEELLFSHASWSMRCKTILSFYMYMCEHWTPHLLSVRFDKTKKHFVVERTWMTEKENEEQQHAKKNQTIAYLWISKHAIIINQPIWSFWSKSRNDILIIYYQVYEKNTRIFKHLFKSSTIYLIAFKLHINNEK